MMIRHEKVSTLLMPHLIQRVQNNIEEPRSRLRGMSCRKAVLRIDRKEFCLI